jgi:PKD repeat protein
MAQQSVGTPQSLCTDPQPALVWDGSTVYQAPNLAEPAPRVAFRDPTFGACVARVTDRDHDLAPGDPSAGMKNEYSRVQAFNADESRILVMGLAATWYVYDAATLQPISQLPFDGPVEPRWHATDPNLLYWVQGTQLSVCDVRTGGSTLVHDFAQDFPGQNLVAVWTRYEGSPSYDGRFFGFQVENENWDPVAFIVYDVASQMVVSNRSVAGLPNIETTDSVSISPLASYFVAFLDPCPQGALGTESNPCGFMVYDADLANGRGLHRNLGHSDLMVDANGREVIVFQDNDSDHITMMDLMTGQVTPLLALDFGANGQLGLHISGRASGLPGWALVSTHDGTAASHTWMDDQLFAVELKPQGRVLRIAHTHSIVDEHQAHDYWAEPHATCNRDMTKLLFTTNWGRSGTEQVEMVLAELPAGWSGAACTVQCTADVVNAAQVNTAVAFHGWGSAVGCGGGVSANWDFGDGTAHGTLFDATHTYTQTGTYTWTLTATSGTTTCVKTGTLTITAEPPCALTCTASVATTPQVGAMVTFYGTATATGCSGTPAYDWDFGDGSAHASTDQAWHAYGAVGTYSWTFRATVQGIACTKSGTVTVIPPIAPPVVSSIAKAGSPFRLKVNGSNFQEGIQVYIGTDQTPWASVTRKSASLVVIKGGSSLKAKFPQGQSVMMWFVNPDHGQTSATYTRP